MVRAALTSLQCLMCFPEASADEIQMLPVVSVAV